MNNKIASKVNDIADRLIGMGMDKAGTLMMLDYYIEDPDEVPAPLVAQDLQDYYEEIWQVLEEHPDEDFDGEIPLEESVSRKLTEGNFVSYAQRLKKDFNKILAPDARPVGMDRDMAITCLAIFNSLFEKLEDPEEAMAQLQDRWSHNEGALVTEDGRRPGPAEADKLVDLVQWFNTEFLPNLNGEEM